LSVIAESVDEASRAMDAVMLGPAERRTVRIDFPLTIRRGNRDEPIDPEAPDPKTPPPSMLVDELLTWTARFATEEGPSLIQLAGRRGVAAVQPTAERLQRLVLGAAQANVPSIGFSRPRVRRALVELADQLGQVERLASELLSEGDRIKKPARAQ
jgi:hypothetical protein